MTAMSKPEKAFLQASEQPKQRADRFNTGKPELSFVFDAPLAMEGLANRFALGAKKYARDNWKKGLPDIEIIDALLRHLSAYQNGESTDPDGGYHVDAIVWNAVVLSEQFHKREKALAEAKQA